MSVFDFFSVVLCLAGTFFFLAATVGLIRFPDILSRLHALTMADNLGLGLIVIGLLFHATSIFHAIKLVLVWILVIFSSAACSYLIAARAIKDKVIDQSKIESQER